MASPKSKFVVPYKSSARKTVARWLTLKWRNRNSLPNTVCSVPLSEFCLIFIGTPPVAVHQVIVSSFNPPITTPVHLSYLAAFTGGCTLVQLQITLDNIPKGTTAAVANTAISPLLDLGTVTTGMQHLITFEAIGSPPGCSLASWTGSWYLYYR